MADKFFLFIEILIIVNLQKSIFTYERTKERTNERIRSHINNFSFFFIIYFIVYEFKWENPPFFCGGGRGRSILNPIFIFLFLFLSIIINNENKKQKNFTVNEQIVRNFFLRGEFSLGNIYGNKVSQSVSLKTSTVNYYSKKMKKEEKNNSPGIFLLREGERGVG